MAGNGGEVRWNGFVWVGDVCRSFVAPTISTMFTPVPTPDPVDNPAGEVPGVFSFHDLGRSSFGVSDVCFASLLTGSVVPTICGGAPTPVPDEALVDNSFRSFDDDNRFRVDRSNGMGPTCIEVAPGVPVIVNAP